MVTTFSETTRHGGFHEIGIYVPEVIEGAGRILVAVISRQCTGGKWCVYSSRSGLIGRYTTKKTALSAANEVAMNSDANKFHAR